MQKSTLAAAVLAAILIFVAGWFAGRWAQERDWSNPRHIVTAADAAKAAIEGADPSPAAGTTIMRPLPLRRMREVMKSFTEKDPVVMTVGTFGRDDEDKNVDMMVQNRGDCAATHLAGVAYGYDAWGFPTQVNKGGEAYVAFDVKDTKIAPGAKAKLGITVKSSSVASLAVVQIDLVECEGGKTWKR